ncbi:hypothetical protein [Dinghuibacter silviterrae]|nr:hypothetical protein [Dinghuibacter silviterrae]
MPKKAKKKPRPVSIEFDETGRIIRFPSPAFNGYDRVVFSVRISRSFFAGEVNPFLDKMDSVYRFFKGNPENQKILWSLFNGNADTTSKWLSDLDDYRSASQALSKNYYNLHQYDPSLNQGFFHYADNLSFFPLSLYFKELLYKQFSVKISAGNDSIKEFFLRPDVAHAWTGKEDCYWWRSETMALDTIFSKDCHCQDEFNISLIYHDPWKSMLINWYNQQFSRCDTSLAKGDTLKWGLAKKLKYLQDGNANIGSLLKTQKRLDSLGLTKSDDKAQQGLRKLAEKDTAVRKLLLYVYTLRTMQYWLLHWIWYNGQYLVVNPVPSHTSAWTVRQKDSLKTLNKALVDAGEEKGFLDTARVHMRPVFAEYDTLKMVINARDVMIDSIDRIKERIGVFDKMLKQDSLSKRIVFADQQFYHLDQPLLPLVKGLLPRKVYLLRQFSLSRDKRYIFPVYQGARNKEASNEMPENGTLWVALHNIPQGAKVSVSQVMTSFNDMEEFTKQVQDLLKGLDSSGIFQTALAKGLSSFTNFTKSLASFNAIDTDKENAARDSGQAHSNSLALPAPAVAYLEKSADMSPVKFDTDMMVVQSVRASLDTARGFLTKSFPGTIDTTGAYQINLSLSIDSIKGKGIIHVGGLHRIQLAAGIAFVGKGVEQTSVDTSGNGFRTSSSTNNAQTIIGIKIYPAKTYLRDGSLWPRYPLRRFSVLFAVSVPKALNNFYVGGGYDLVPGLTFTMGDNIYKQNFYQVRNAQIVNSATRYRSAGLYYGVTVNPILFVQFVKLFFNN